MVKYQSVKAFRLRQLLSLIVLACVGCGGGEEVDFSKPTAGGGTGKKWDPNAALARTPAAQLATKSNDTATTAATTSADEKSADTPDKTASAELKVTGAKSPSSSAAKAAVVKKKGAVVRTKKAANADDRRRFDDDDLNPYANWRTATFTLSESDADALAARRRVGFSENGRLLAAADLNGEIILFRTRFGEVQGLFSSFEETVGVAVSDAASMLLVDSGETGISVVQLKDLSRLDLFARDEYFVAQATRSPIVFSENPIKLMQFFGGGKLLVTADETGQVQIREPKTWSPDTNEWPAITTIDAHEGAVIAAAVTKDGTQIATTGRDGAVKVWDIKTGEAIAELEPVAVPALCICEIKKGFAIGRANGVMELWTNVAEDEQSIEEVLDRNPTAIASLFIEPKKNFLVKCTATGAVGLRDMQGDEDLSSSRPHKRPILCAVSSPSLDRIQTICVDGNYNSWPSIDLRERRVARDQDTARSDAINNPVRAFRVGELSRKANSRDDDYSVAQTAMLDSFRATPETAEDVTPDQLAATLLMRKSSEPDRVAPRKAITATEPVAATDKTPERVRSITTDFTSATVENVQLALSDSGETLALAVAPVKGRSDGSLHVWDVPTSTKLRKWTTDRAFEEVRFVGGGNYLLPFPRAVRGRREEYAAGFFDIRTGELLPADGEPKSVAEKDDVIAVGYVGKYGTVGRAIQLLDSKTREPLEEMTGFEMLIPAIVIMPDGNLLVSVRDRTGCRLVLMERGNLGVEEPLAEFKIPDPWVRRDGTYVDLPGITDLLVSPDGNTIAMQGRYLSGDYRFTIWKRKSGRFDPENAKTVKQSLSFLIDTKAIGDRMLFTGNKTLTALTTKGLVTIDTETGRANEPVVLPSIMSVFDPSGMWLASHDGTGAIELRSLRNPDAKVRRFRAQNAPVMAMAFSRDGRMLATVGEENVLNVWRIDEWAKRGGAASKRRKKSSNRK